MLMGHPVLWNILSHNLCEFVSLGRVKMNQFPTFVDKRKITNPGDFIRWFCIILKFWYPRGPFKRSLRTLYWKLWILANWYDNVFMPRIDNFRLYKNRLMNLPLNVISRRRILERFPCLKSILWVQPNPANNHMISTKNANGMVQMEISTLQLEKLNPMKRCV